MRLTKDETKAKIFTNVDAAIDEAAEINYRTNPHVTGKIAHVEAAHVVADRSEWPRRQRYAIGIYQTDTGVRVGLLCAIVTLAMASGCARYCSARPHYHQDAPSAEFIPCDTDADCQLKNGREY